MRTAFLFVAFFICTQAALAEGLSAQPATAAARTSPFFMPEKGGKEVLSAEETYYLTGQNFLDKRDFKHLETTAKLAAKEHPDWASPYYFLAFVAQENLEDEEALRLFSRALNTRPNWIKLSLVYAANLRIGYHANQALGVCDKALALCKNAKPDKRVTEAVKELLVEKGMSLVEAKKYDAAIKFFQESPSHISDIRSQIAMARAYIALQKPDKAVDICNTAIAAAPRSCGAHYMRAKGLALMRRPKQALADLDRMVALCRDEQTHAGNALQRNLKMHELRLEVQSMLGNKAEVKKEIAAIKQLRGDAYEDTPFQSERGR